MQIEFVWALVFCWWIIFVVIVFVVDKNLYMLFFPLWDEIFHLFTSFAWINKSPLASYSMQRSTSDKWKKIIENTDRYRSQSVWLGKKHIILQFHYANSIRVLCDSTRKNWNNAKTCTIYISNLFFLPPSKLEIIGNFSMR